MMRRCFRFRMYLGLLALMLVTASASAQLVSHWTFDKDPQGSPWGNSVSGGPNMVYDAATKAPALFDTTQVRIETAGTPNTRISADSPIFSASTFSFSMIIDPTDLFDFGALLVKENNDTGGADFARVGWAVQKVPGSMEFVVRGSDVATKDFFGNKFVPDFATGMPTGGNFDSNARWQIAGGYDAATGDMSFYVTPIDAGPISDLLGGTETKDPGATQDSTPLSLGTFQRESNGGGREYIGGSGFDIDDLQIYNRLLTRQEFLYLAQNPGAEIPEPSSMAMICLAFGLVGMLRRNGR